MSVRRRIGVDRTDRAGQEGDNFALGSGEVEVERCLGVERELEVFDLKGAGHVTTPRQFADGSG